MYHNIVLPLQHIRKCGIQYRINKTPEKSQVAKIFRL